MPTRPSPKTESTLNRGILDELLGFHVRLAQLAIHEGFERNTPVRSITPGQLTILVLIDRNRDLTQQQLSDRMRVKKSTVTVTLHRLCQRGFVRRVRSEQDRRANALRLTVQGARALAKLIAYVTSYERELSKRMTPSERRTLIRLLAKVSRPQPSARVP